MFVYVRLQKHKQLPVTSAPLQCNPPESDLCDDLSDLQCVNESAVLHTLTSRAKANMPLTHAGPNLVNLWPPLQSPSKVRSDRRRARGPDSPTPPTQTPKLRRGDSAWDAPPALAALVKRLYISMVGTRRDHCVCALGRSGTGKTAACQAFTLALLKQAGTAAGSFSGEFFLRGSYAGGGPLTDRVLRPQRSASRPCSPCCAPSAAWARSRATPPPASPWCSLWTSTTPDRRRPDTCRRAAGTFGSV